jgi:hypothetical protein
MSERNYCDGCGHSISKHYKDVRDVVRCTVVEHGTSSRGIIGLPYQKDCDCANYKLPKQKASRTGTVYDDEIAIAIEDAETFRKAVKRAKRKMR